MLFLNLHFQDVQTKMCGAKGISYSANISFPVNKKAFEQAKYSASKQADDDGKIIGIDNDFMKAYIDISDNVNASLCIKMCHIHIIMTMLSVTLLTTILIKVYQKINLFVSLHRQRKFF